MRVLFLVGLVLAACAPVRGPVDRVGQNVTVTEPGSTTATSAPPALGANGLPFSLRLF